jgi:hypothetical protein
MSQSYLLVLPICALPPRASCSRRSEDFLASDALLETSHRTRNEIFTARNRHFARFFVADSRLYAPERTPVRMQPPAATRSLRDQCSSRSTHRHKAHTNAVADRARRASSIIELSNGAVYSKRICCASRSWSHRLQLTTEADRARQDWTAYHRRLHLRHTHIQTLV